ncbi:unnamed protein product [Phytophthora fragariaefolia]|uniref:Unnamed protein product n=1 Tax=Phytophthora fragariaefolia TaxID=1490495 RepID=A0A9W7DAR3_9STRA|nr:unnamed protein product [Phytophthora fragariaefolia]
MPKFIDEDAAISDDDVRMDIDFRRALYTASNVVLPVDYSEKLHEELWDIKKIRNETLAEYSKRFRATVRNECTLTRLIENPPMREDALRRLYKRDLPFDLQNKYDASGQFNSTVAAPFIEIIEQGEQSWHRAGGQDKRNIAQDNARHHSRRSNSGRRGNNHSHQPRGGNRGRGNCYNNSRVNKNSNGNNNSNSSNNERGSGGHRQAYIRVENRSLRFNNSSDEEFMFVGLHNQSKTTPHPMRIMIKLEHCKDRYHALLDSGCSRPIICTDVMQTTQAQGGTLETSRVSFDLVTGSTTSEKELRRFLGMVPYYRKMVPNTSSLAARLNRLTSKNVSFVWT